MAHASTPAPARALKATEMCYPESIPDSLDRVFLAGLILACFKG